MVKILVIVDTQEDFIYGPLGTPEAQAIVPNVNKKIKGMTRIYSPGTCRLSRLTRRLTEKG